MKRSHIRILIGLAAAGSALGFGASQASAATWSVSPANTAFTATSSSVTLGSGSATITCTGSTINGTTGDGSNAADLATIASSGNSFSGCTDNIVGGSWTITLSGGDLSGSSYDASTGTTTGTITGITATASGSDLGLTCSFTASGTADVTYTNPGTLALTGGSLTLSNVSGSACSLGGISNGDTGSATGTYTVSSPSGGITVSAS